MTITVKLDDELEARVRAQLHAGTTLSDFVRTALIEKLERDDSRASPYELWQQYFDGWGSGETDRSERIEELVTEKVRAKHRTR